MEIICTLGLYIMKGVSECDMCGLRVGSEGQMPDSIQEEVIYHK